MRKLFEYIRNHPIWLGIAGSVCLMGMIVCYQLSVSRGWEESTVETLELQRDAVIDKRNHPEYLVRYLLVAAKKQDIDMALRGFAMDESILNLSLENIINTEGRFYTDMEIPPSGSYSTYNEISAAELAGNYSQSIQQVFDFFAEKESLKVKKIDYVKPEEQLSSEERSKNEGIIEARGGDCICEMMVLLESQGDEYILGVTLNHYEDYWKILHLGSSLLQTTGEEPIRVTDEEEYKALKGTLEKNRFQEELQNTSIDYELFDEETESINYEELLPANYFIVNSLEEMDPQQVIEKFVLSIEKKELVRAMGYCMETEIGELEHTTLDILQRQADCAKQIKKFCYGFLGCDYLKSESDLKQIGKSGSRIEKELNPQYFMYFDLLDAFVIKDNGSEIQYLVCYLYNGEYYISGMTLVESDGWKIRSLTISSDEIELNQLERIKKSEYEDIKNRYYTD